MSKVFEFPDVTRLTVVGEDGVEMDRYSMYSRGVQVHIQDNGRTLKLFPVYS